MWLGFQGSINRNGLVGFVSGRGRINNFAVGIRWMGGAVNARLPLAVYDLDGDGIPEVIYSNETYLFALDGRDGSLKFKLLLEKLDSIKLELLRLRAVLLPEEELSEEEKKELEEARKEIAEGSFVRLEDLEEMDE